MSRVPLEIALKPVETLVFRSDVVAFGTFRCPTTHPLFRDSGPCSHHTFVFPRTSTVIRPSGGQAFTAGPNCVTLYNQHQEYTRSPIDPVDACDWYVVADDVLAPALDVERPFRRPHVPVDSQTYLMQRRLFESAATADALEVEETALDLFGRVISAEQRTAMHRDEVEAVKETIAAAPERRLSLRELASIAGLSPFHLCRAFHRSAGTSITDFRHSLRLRLSLEMLRDSRRDLTEVALHLGYATHSHFTSAFRRRFGITPSQYRARS